jgi:hypothetical protein
LGVSCNRKSLPIPYTLEANAMLCERSRQL